MAPSIPEVLTQLREQLTASKIVASAALHGSYVGGDHDATRDINLALVVRGDDLSGIAAPLLAAWRAARVDPWIVRDEELPGLVDVFATRVREIQRRHEMLLGDDPWTALRVPRAALRLRIEQELRNHQLRMRRVEVLGDAASRARQLVIAAAALRHDLGLVEELAGAAVPGTLDALADAAAARFALPRHDVHAVLAFGRMAAGQGAPPWSPAARLVERAVSFVDSLEDP